MAWCTQKLVHSKQVTNQEAEIRIKETKKLQNQKMGDYTKFTKRIIPLKYKPVFSATRKN
jgi:hypothetical protein